MSINTIFRTNSMVFFIVLCSVVLFGWIHQLIYSVELHNDEISWFYHTEFFEQAFIKHDVHSSMWSSYESYDHPQLSKYIYGGYVWLKNPSIFTTRATLQDMYGRWKFYFNSDLERIRNQIFAPYLYTMREINSIFFLGSLVLIGAVVFIVTSSSLLPIIGIVWLMQNTLFANTMIRATSDAQVIFFVYASLVSYMVYMQKKGIGALICSGLYAGCAISAKLTGALVLYSLLINEITRWFFGWEKSKRIQKTIGFLIGLSMVIWIGLNPALYTNPIGGSIRYFDFRIEQSKRLQGAFPEVALTNILSRTHTMYCTVLDPSCKGSFYHGTLFPFAWLNIIATILGIIFLVERGKIKKHREMIVSISLYMVIVIFVITNLLVLNSDRYFIPVQINVWMIEWFGMYWIYMHGILKIQALMRKK